VEMVKAKAQETLDVRLEPSLTAVWSQVLEILSSAVSVPKFEAFIRPTQLIELTSDEAVIGVNNDFNKDALSRDLPTIACAFQQVLNRKIDIKILVCPDSKQRTYIPSIASITVLSGNISENTAANAAAVTDASADPFSKAAAADAQSNLTLSGLSPKNTFDSFVVGSHNRFCHAAGMAVATNPGQTYNPLFLYGGVGLGKTHLMQALGHQILNHFPGMAVRYINCERFTNELINHIGSGRMIDFRKRYRQIDVLLVDDIQFIEGKERTQEEFFHTFNALRDSGKQIVISSDRPPQALSKLEERLRSRFEWGLVADIQAPDLETRVAILRKKSELEQMPIPDEIIDYIATLFTTNIRELEGALLKAHAYSTMTGIQLHLDTIGGILCPGGQHPSAQVNLSMEKIIETVAKHYRVDIKKLKSPDRSAALALPRHIAMYLSYEMLGTSLPRIGQFFGNRRHTSALHGYKKIKLLISKESNIAHSVQQIKVLLSK
jgi:chromosomal replication initiator protein